MKNPLLWALFVLLLATGYIIGRIDNAPKPVDVSELPSRFDE